jgi:hypothetical protein
MDLLFVIFVNYIQYHILGYCDNELKTNNPYQLEYLGSENDTINHCFKRMTIL